MIELRVVRSTYFWAFSLVTLAAWSAPAYGQQRFLVTMQSGMQIGPGMISEIPSIDGGAFKQERSGDGLSKPILLIDDDLRKTYIAKAQVLASTPFETRPEKIEIPQIVAPDRAAQMVSVGRLTNVTPFNSYGRRLVTVATPLGPRDIHQGITEINPIYLRVEGLRTETPTRWDMRMSTKAITHAELDDILRHQLDMSKPQSWFSIVRLYSQADRFREARDTLAEAIVRLSESNPNEVEAMRAELKRLDQQFAGQMFREVELRLDSGQPQLASGILQNFPLDQLALETQLKAQDRIVALQRRQTQITELINALESLRKELGDNQKAGVLVEVVDEIAKNLSLNTVDRLADFARLKDDKTLSVDQRVSLAISGWFLGSGAAVDNLAVASSLLETRRLIRDYLLSTNENQRQGILTKLKTLESGNAKYVAAILALMPPPLPLPERVENDPAGLYRVELPDGEGKSIRYLIQLPPEYDPNRKYPCVVALQSFGISTDAMVDWWAGPYAEVIQGRGGPASRYGYIVIAPEWITEDQVEYRYTEQEHHRVLKAFRDAQRRTSINTDRVFLSGHAVGGNAAWDIALAHPDLWAGVIVVAGNAGKYLQRYRDNAKTVPLYFVFGELDGTPFTVSGTELNEYVTSRFYDSIVVSYRGRGAGHFQEEIDRIIQWMNLSSHARKPFPQSIAVSANRVSDRFFWWLEADQLAPGITQHPLLYEKNNANQGKIEANILDPAANGLRVIKMPAKKYTVWLHPDMVDFTRPVRVDFEGTSRRLEVAPDVAVILEDSRTRGERIRPFWARVDK